MNSYLNKLNLPSINAFILQCPVKFASFLLEFCIFEIETFVYFIFSILIAKIAIAQSILSKFYGYGTLYPSFCS